MDRVRSLPPPPRPGPARLGVCAAERSEAKFRGAGSWSGGDGPKRRAREPFRGASSRHALRFVHRLSTAHCRERTSVRTTAMVACPRLTAVPRMASPDTGERCRVLRRPGCCLLARSRLPCTMETGTGSRRVGLGRGKVMDRLNATARKDTRDWRALQDRVATLKPFAPPLGDLVPRARRDARARPCDGELRLGRRETVRVSR